MTNDPSSVSGWGGEADVGEGSATVSRRRLTETQENPKMSETGRRSPRDIVERTAEFGDRVIRLCLALPNHCAGWEIGKQLVRCGTSIGSNVEEVRQRRAARTLFTR